MRCMSGASVGKPLASVQPVERGDGANETGACAAGAGNDAGGGVDAHPPARITITAQTGQIVRRRPITRASSRWIAAAIERYAVDVVLMCRETSGSCADGSSRAGTDAVSSIVHRSIGG
jgi:hypothetical protein